MKTPMIVAAAMIAAFGSAMAQAERKCQLLTIAEWPVRAQHYLPVVDGAINGQKIGILLDTGSYTSLVRRSAVARLGLELAPDIDGTPTYGVQGGSRTEGALIKELRIGNAVRKDWLATVTGEGQLTGDVALLLGYEFFRQMDLELDLPHNAVRLFQPKDCDGASLAYWSNDALAIPLERGRRLQFMVAVNGKDLVAELDTGASTNILSMEGAVIAGLSPQTPGVTGAGCIAGSGKDGLESWISTVKSFAIGGEVISNPQIRFADLWRRMVYYHTSSNLPRRMPNMADMLLGVDFLRSHRVYIAHSQNKLYFSYTGGTVFPVRKGKPCSDGAN